MLAPVILGVKNGKRTRYAANLQTKIHTPTGELPKPWERTKPVVDTMGNTHLMQAFRTTTMEGNTMVYVPKHYWAIIDGETLISLNPFPEAIEAPAFHIAAYEASTTEAGRATSKPRRTINTSGDPSLNGEGYAWLTREQHEAIKRLVTLDFLNGLNVLPLIETGIVNPHHRVTASTWNGIENPLSVHRIVKEISDEKEVH